MDALVSLIADDKVTHVQGQMLASVRVRLVSHFHPWLRTCLRSMPGHFVADKRSRCCHHYTAKMICSIAWRSGTGCIGPIQPHSRFPSPSMTKHIDITCLFIETEIGRIRSTDWATPVPEWCHGASGTANLKQDRRLSHHSATCEVRIWGATITQPRFSFSGEISSEIPIGAGVTLNVARMISANAYHATHHTRLSGGRNGPCGGWPCCHPRLPNRILTLGCSMRLA